MNNPAMLGSRVLGSLVAAIAAVALLVAVPAASAKTSFRWIDGVDQAQTPDQYDKVGILKVGPRKATNVLVLNPGTSASAAYFKPLANFVARQADGWQVWAVERRENLLEDQSVVDQAKQGKATTQRLFDYYLGYLNDPSVTSHYQPVNDADVPFAREWGMATEIGDLRKVVKKAQKLGGKVVVGGHSLGGSITTAYATWDFNGRPGAKGLSGLVFIDGASSPEATSPDVASQRLAELQTESPWLAFGGIAAPYAGLFNVVGSTGTHAEPDAVGALQSWALLPGYLKPPVTATNQAAYGYALDTETSPPALAAAQAHLGHLAASGDPRPWDQAGELTPVDRFAKMFSGTGILGHDGTAWYHPLRLTIDSGAVGDGNPNPAQPILGVNAIHGSDLSPRLRMLAFGAALGGQRVLDATKALAAQSGIPRNRLTLLNRASTYAHNDPNSAYPDNEFVDRLIPFLGKIAKH